MRKYVTIVSATFCVLMPIAMAIDIALKRGVIPARPESTMVQYDTILFLMAWLVNVIWLSREALRHQN